MATAWSLPRKTSRARGSREVSSPLACFKGLVGHGMWGFLPQEADKVAHPGDWFLPKIRTPESSLRSILGWLHNKIGGKKRKNERNQTVRIVCLYQEEFGFCTWLGSPLLWNMSCSGTLELVLMGTNSQGTAEGGALPKLPGEDCRHQGREHQGCFQQGKCSVQ